MWRSRIIEYIFWGLILTVILPKCAEYILKRYENHAALNQLIFSEGIKPFRAKQIECNHKNLMLIGEISEEVEDWKLIKGFAK